MYEIAQSLKGAKVVNGCSGIVVATMGGEDGWDPLGPRARPETYRLSEADNE